MEVCVDGSSCKECPINPNYGNYGYCTNLALTYALDLINRQKAEIESLNNALDEQCDACSCVLLDERDKARAEAIKEFAKYLIDKSKKGCIHASDLPDHVIDFAEGGANK